MVVLFEIAPPFRWRPKAEKAGPLRRWIWGWFSVAYIAAGFNDISEAIRQDERELMSSNTFSNEREVRNGKNRIRF